MGKKKEPSAPAPPAAPAQPVLPGLTVEELKLLLGDKEVLILQMSKLVKTLKEQNTALAKAVIDQSAEIAELKGKKKQADK